MKRLLLAWLAGFGLVLSAQDQTAPSSAVPPPVAAAPKRSAAELEKLVAPIALYPDPLIATILPASVYPLEIVQAARFVRDTNNLAQIDAQPWDENVKAVARVPAAIQKMNDDLQWTISLGDAFLVQDKELMEAIQTLRRKAQEAGTLQTTPQQVVVVTNSVTETTVEQQVVVVTNTIVQIQPSNPQVIYVPQYDPVVVYYPPPAYVYNPYAPLVTFGVGVAVGAIIANNCDWHGGGVYVGHHGVVAWSGGHGDVDINNNFNRNVNRNVNVNPRPTPVSGGGQGKWQPDQNRLRANGSQGGSAATREARGWGPAATPRPATGNVAGRPSAGTQPARPSTGNVSTRPATGNVAARPSTGNLPQRSPGAGAAARPAAPATRPAAPAPSRPTPTPSPPQPRPTTAGNRQPSGGSAFSGVNNGASARSYGNRGAASRGGGRGGGGRGGRR